MLHFFFLEDINTYRDKINKIYIQGEETPRITCLALIQVTEEEFMRS